MKPKTLAGPGDETPGTSSGACSFGPASLRALDAGPAIHVPLGYPETLGCRSTVTTAALTRLPKKRLSHRTQPARRQIISVCGSDAAARKRPESPLPTEPRLTPRGSRIHPRHHP